MKRWACIGRLGGIGDNLVAGAPLRMLKKLGYATEVITSETASVVFNNNPHLDKLSVKRDGDLPGGQDWHTWFESRSKEYDLFANLSNSMETRHALHKGSTAFWWPSEYRRKMCAGSYLETPFDILNVPYDFGPLFFPTDEERNRAIETRDEQIGGKYLAWVISGSRVDKVYPFAAMAICRIIKELGIPVVMIGTGVQQFQYAKIVQEAVRITNSTDRNFFLALSPDDSDPGGHQHWGVRRSLTQAMTAGLVVTPDTGVGWAVAMEEVPKIAMLSHASVENITKHWTNTVTLHADQNRVPCWPCHRLHDDISTCTPAKFDKIIAACMADISVETVVREIERIWHSNNVVPLRQAAE